MRDYLNEGGRVLYTGKYAGHQYTPALGNQLYDPFENQQCRRVRRSRRAAGRWADPVTGGNDVLEYWFGAGLLNDNAGIDPNGQHVRRRGVDGSVHRPVVGFNGGQSAKNQDHSASFIATSALLPAERLPAVRQLAAAKYDRPGGPFDPHTGIVLHVLADRATRRTSG